MLMACLDKWLVDGEFQARQRDVFFICLTQLRQAAEDDVQILGEPVLYFRAKLTHRGKGTTTAQHKLTWAAALTFVLYGAPGTPFSVQQLQEALVKAVELSGAQRKVGSLRKLR